MYWPTPDQQRYRSDSDIDRDLQCIYGRYTDTLDRDRAAEYSKQFQFYVIPALKWRPPFEKINPAIVKERQNAKFDPLEITY